MVTPSGFVKLNPCFVPISQISWPRYWCWFWLRGHTNQVSGCTNLWNWSKSASGAHAVLPLSTRVSAWNLLWTFLGTFLDMFGLSDSCGGFGLQIHDPSFSSLNAYLTYFCLLCSPKCSFKQHSNFRRFLHSLLNGRCRSSLIILRLTTRRYWCCRGTNPGTIPSSRFPCWPSWRTSPTSGIVKIC